jgi:hypothetical protein
MSMSPIDRRQFLTLPLVLFLGPALRAAAEATVRRGRYAADVGILYDMLTFRLEGTIEESINREAGQYQVTIAGAGSSISNRIESSGVLRAGRWAPLRSQSFFEVRGRQSRTDIAYDYGRRVVEYHARAETFFLGRMRIVDDRVPIPEGTHLDDVISATLNYAEGHWTPQGTDTYRTFVVRRRRSDDEGPDDVAGSYRAEVVPLELKVAPDPETGKPSALFDLTRFSSWAKKSQPARIVFGADRRPELITSSMILGTSVTIRLA